MALVTQNAQVTLQSGAAQTGAGTLMDSGGFGAVLVELSGTWVATVTFEGTVTGGVWGAIAGTQNIATGAMASTATATGLYLIPVVGFQQVRARISAFTSGALTAIALGILGDGFTSVVTLTGAVPAGSNVIGTVKTAGLKGYAAQSAGAAGTATAPAMGAAIATIGSGSLPAGDYEVTVVYGYGATGDVVNNMQLQNGAAVVSVLALTVAVNQLQARTFPRITMSGANALTVNAVAAGAGGSIYLAEIIATQLA